MLFYANLHYLTDKGIFNSSHLLIYTWIFLHFVRFLTFGYPSVLLELFCSAGCVSLENRRLHGLLDVTSKFLWSDGDGLYHVLGNIVTLVVVVVEIGVLLGEDEGLVGASVLVEIGDVETSKSSIVAAAGEEDPTTIA